MKKLIKTHWVLFVAIIINLICIATDNNDIMAQDTSIEAAYRVRQQRIDLETQRALSLRREASQRLLWDWGVYERFSYLTYDDIDNEGVNDKRRTNRTNNVYLWGSLNLDDIHSFYANFNLQLIDWNHGDEYRSTENQFHFNLEEGFNEGTYILHIDKALEKYLNYSIPVQMELTAGRFSSYVGNQIAYSKRGNGLQLDVKSKLVDFKLFGFRNLNDEENIDYSVPGFRSSRRFFYGAELKYNGFDMHEPYVYALIQEDDCGENIEDLDQDYDFNSRHYGIGSRGMIYKGISYMIEGILEDGDRYPESDGVGPPPDNVDIDAWAFDASLSYTYNIQTHPRFSAEYAFGSGDPDRTEKGKVTPTIGGNKEGSTERGFLGFGYVNTGVAMAPRLSNLHMYRFGFSFKPLEFMNNNNVDIGVDFFLFRKDKAEAAISDTRADRPQRSLGKEFDVNIKWQIFSDLSTAIDYGRFYPSNAYSDKEARDYVMFAMMYSF